VNLNLPYPGFSAPRVETALDVSRFERVAGVRREQELVAFAADADLRPFRRSAAGLELPVIRTAANGPV
jgi:hypothetical protein